MSSKTDSFLKLGLFFFVALLSFSIGTFVGKKFSDNQHELASLEPQKNSHGEGHDTGHGSREVASAHGDSKEGKSGAMSDEEIAKLAEEFVADDTVPANTAAHGEPHGSGHGEAKESNEHAVKAEAPEAHGEQHGGGHETAAAPHAEAPHAEASEIAKNISQGNSAEKESPHASPIKKAKEDRLPSSVPKDVNQYAVGKFTVQVAAYPQESEAQKMASELKNKGFGAFYIPANVKGTTYYRVSVGQFATQKEATDYKVEFLAKSKMGSALVQKISE